MADDPLDPGRFGAGDPFSLGVEEELRLVDPVTGALRNCGGAVFERLERRPAARSSARCTPASSS